MTSNPGVSLSRTSRLDSRTIFAVLLVVTSLSCARTASAPVSTPSRIGSLPVEATKVLPGMDLYPPRTLTDQYLDPVPVPFPINTAGAEDSAFITPDGQTLYLWFTPDASLPAEKQLRYGVTGIYVAYRHGDAWTEPSRIQLAEPGTPALDGCEFVLGPTMWFCTARQGYEGIQWFTADLVDGRWTNWQPAGFPSEYQVGELHLTSDGRQLYFHSPRPGGHGDLDIWVSEQWDGEWQSPTNVDRVNSASAEGWPFVTPDGSQLWFTRSAGSPSLWRSVWEGGAWGEPKEMFSPFAGEASLDSNGNVYFSHHFFRDNRMLEADIYVARPRTE